MSDQKPANDNKVVDLFTKQPKTVKEVKKETRSRGKVRHHIERVMKQFHGEDWQDVILLFSRPDKEDGKMIYQCAAFEIGTLDRYMPLNETCALLGVLLSHVNSR